MSKGRCANVLERARVSAENCSERHGAILLEVLASVYSVDEGNQGKTAVGSDIAAWLDAFDEGDLPQQGWRRWLFGLSPARETMMDKGMSLV
jgi:hypothetical protein